MRKLFEELETSFCETLENYFWELRKRFMEFEKTDCEIELEKIFVEFEKTVFGLI